MITEKSDSIPAGQLIIQYIDGTLDDKGVDELNELLKNDASLRREAANLLVLELHLRELGQEERARLPKRAHAPPGFGLKLGWLAWIGRVRPFRLRWAALLAVIAAAMWVLLSPSSDPTPRLERAVGKLRVERSGSRITSATGLALQPGDRLILETNASAVIRYSKEATWLRLPNSSEARVESSGKGKTVALIAGTLSATVARQRAGFPMRFITPQGEATVLGTELSLSSDSQVTRLEVWTGKVRLTEAEHESFVDVHAGEFAVARRGSPLQKGLIHRGVLREFWLGAEGPPDTRLSDLPCLNSPPSGSEHLSDFRSPIHVSAARVARLRAYVRPPQTGLYQFWVTGVNGAELWLSRDEHPEHKTRVCAVPQQIGGREWDKRLLQPSAPVVLEAGRKYYLEALQYERPGVRNGGVAWQVAGKARETIPGQYLLLPSISDGFR